MTMRFWGLCRTVRAVAGTLGFLVLAMLWLMLAAGVPWRGRMAWLAWRVLLAGFGLRLHVAGRPEARALFVANHVSWSDIPVLALLTGGGFVAKSEVAAWPVIGPLARRLDCVFVDRDRRMAVAGQADAVHGGLSGGAGLVLFPEGTTSDGASMLPFRSSLFAVVGKAAGMQVQPVGIAYRAPDGSPLSAAGRRAVAWLGDDALLPHALALARRGGAVVDVWFGPPLTVSCRKQAAEACRRAILGWLAECQAAELKRAA